MNIEDLPLILNVKEAAQFWGVSVGEIYRDPKRYGGRKLRGRGRWRFPRDVLVIMAGLIQK